jgi:WD domain, G-beta repeat.
VPAAQGAGVTFEIGDEIHPQQPPGQEEDDRGWECVWSCHTATPVFHMSFSPDGTLFATAGRSDRLVKIWFENKQCKFSEHFWSHYLVFLHGHGWILGSDRNGGLFVCCPAFIIIFILFASF